MPLVVLGIPPILVNVYEGVAGVDPDLKDAARGMGMTPWQQVRKVEVPVALPLIVLGLRTAAIFVVPPRRSRPISAWAAWAVTYSTGSRLTITGKSPAGHCSLSSWRSPCKRFSLGCAWPSRRACASKSARPDSY